MLLSSIVAHFQYPDIKGITTPKLDKLLAKSVSARAFKRMTLQELSSRKSYMDHNHYFSPRGGKGQAMCLVILCIL